MYKYALSMQAIPVLAFSVSNIIKSVYGKNRKALALDLDNTLWGGVVGDDGVENLEIGQETAMGEVFHEFQAYLKELKEIGGLLTPSIPKTMRRTRSTVFAIRQEYCVRRTL